MTPIQSKKTTAKSTQTQADEMPDELPFAFVKDANSLKSSQSCSLAKNRLNRMDRLGKIGR